MRKHSIKALSLVLSLLLVIPMLAALSVPVQAATAVVGDLDGDGDCDTDDITILKTVLGDPRSAAVDMKYDLSGNRMVDNDDLTVLNNLVDPSQPALEDKLDNGTDDLLVGTTGGLQGTVVLGDSTRAVGANGKTVKVMFAETQDWRQKKALKMDALWVSGEEFGFTLLDANGKAIGAEKKVTCEKAEWSSIEVPLNGAASRDRAAVGGFMISAPDAEVYLDNLSLVDMEATDMSTDVTREEMEKALVEVAWNYYLKAGKIQYDSVEFNTTGSAGSNSPLSKDYGSAWRTNPFSTLEDATSDSNIYSVCSDYCWSVYNEALGYPVLGNRVNAVTPGLFYNTQYPQDMAVLRWWDAGVDTGKLETHNNGVDVEPTHLATEVIEFFGDVNNFRPGDIIVMHGNGGHQHAMIYVGNGQILHCGGGKLDMETGKDDTEPNGAIHLTSIEGTFFGYDQDGYFNLENSASLGAIADANTYGAWLVVVRPLDVLTVDDADGNLANDKLDLTYELNTGLLKYELNGQIGEKPISNNHSVKTSGYEGITAVTQTRLDYPGMDIDRTVSVKNYGTVAQGGELTYKITITNNSNNENYITSYGKNNYTGEAYTGLVVTETIPANAAFVSSSDGTAPDADGKITWTVDVEAGSYVELTYTVKATGNRGDKIVNGGGYVGNIPSNVLTTTIGGEKLANVDADFVSAGVSGWNDANGIYKISANPADGTDFAERVYNEMTGLALELPSVQELASNFFTQKKLYQPYGLHQSYNKSITRYMYTLNSRDEMAEDYLTYRNMLVEGYYGGIWVYSNDYGDEPRIIDPNVRDLEIGDILVCMNLTGSVSGGLQKEEQTVCSWRVMVYLGDGFASLDSNKQMLKAPDSAAVSALTYDMFLVLRPSQAYDDVNSIEAFDGNRADLTDEDKTYAYVAPATSEPLSADNQNRIAALTKDEAETDSEGNTIPVWTAGNLAFATQVYKEIGIDIRSNGLKGAAFSTMLNEGVFVGKTLATNPPLGYEELHTMVLYYGGGTEFAEGHELPSLDSLTIGDVIILGNRDENVSAYLCAIYQGKDTDGNGKFLIGTREFPEGTTDVQVNSYYQETVTDLTTWLGQQIYEDSTENTATYKGYVVLRPSMAYENINELRVRDITENALTADEIAALQSLTIEDWLDGDRATQFSHFPGWAYRSAKVDIDDIVDGKTATYAQLAIFKTVSGKLVPMVPGDANYDANYANMLVHGLYGGAQTKNPERLISADELEVGDIFVAAKRNTDSSISGNYVYRVALYQGVNEEGNAQFLITDVVSGGEGGTAWISTGSGNSDTDIIDTDYSEWLYYFVLRPQQLASAGLWSIHPQDFTMVAGDSMEFSGLTVLTAPENAAYTIDTVVSSDESVIKIVDGKIVAVQKGKCTLTVTCGDLTASCTVTVPTRNITTGILTAEEMDAIANYPGGEADRWYTFAKPFYKRAGISVVAFDGSVDVNKYNAVRGYLMENGELIAGDTDYHKMLVPGYYGGKKMSIEKAFVPEDFKVGDLFLTAGAKCTCNEDTTLNKYPYITGVYLGEGKFRVARLGCSACSTVYTDEYNSETALPEGYISLWSDGETMCAAYEYYFVLRPERLAARSITTGALTPEEMAAISDLQKEDVTVANPGPVMGEVYDAAGINVSDIFNKFGANDLFKKALGTHATPDANIVQAYRAETYGGATPKVTKTFVPDDFKVGDVLVANYKCSHAKWPTITAIYQGEGKFLVALNKGSGDACTCSSVAYYDQYASNGDHDAEGYRSIWGAEKDAEKDGDGAWLQYMVFRPERLAPVSLEKSEVTLYRNEAEQLTFAVEPENVVSKIWTSSNTAVATVDAEGNVTGKSAGTAVITVIYNGYKASCVVTVSEDRLITSGALTKAEMDAFAGFTTSKVTISSVAGEAYTRANITGIYELLDKLHSGNVRKQVLNDDGTVITTETNYTKMLMPGFYGGSKVSTDKTFKPEDLKPGDLFGAVILSDGPVCEHCTRNYDYISAVYLGDETFYVVSQYCTSCTGYLDKKGEAITTGATAGHSTVSLWTTNAAELEGLYGYYFVLRPERLAADAIQSISLSGDTSVAKYATTTLSVTKDPEGAAPDATVTWRSSDETVATVDANGVVTGVKVGTAIITAYCDGYSASYEVNVTVRSIATGALTPEEMAAISNLQKEDVTVANPGPVMGEVYDAAGINVSDIFNKFGANDLFKKALGTHATPDANIVQAYRAETYGGATPKVTKTFVPDDFKVGDVLVANYKCSHAKWPTITAIYQGEGKFLVALNKGSGDACTCSSVAYYDQYASNGDHDAEGYRSIWGAEKDAEKDGDGAWLQYMVFRPERLAPVSLEKSEVTLYRNEAEQLTFAVEPENVVSKIWTSSNTAVATVDAEGNVTGKSAGTAVITVIYNGYKASCVVTVSEDRLITSGALTDDEMTAISSLTEESLSTLEEYTSGPVINAIYQAAAIDVSGIFTNYGAKAVITQANTADTDISDTYWGVHYGQESTNGGTKTFVPTDFKVGDILVANYKCANTETNHWPTITAVYQGDGQFLAVRHSGVADCATCSKDVYFDIYDAEGNHSAEGHRSIWGEEKDQNGTAEGSKWLNYMVLRPERLAADALQSVTIPNSDTVLELNFTTTSLPKANAAALAFDKVPATAADPKNVTWTTSNPDVATVVDGKLTVVGAGTCTITVYCDGCTATRKVTVSRGIATRTTLTATEQEAIKTFTADETLDIKDFPIEAYSAAGIDVSSLFNTTRFWTLMGYNFDTNSYALLESGYDADHRTMLLDGYYGGDKTAADKVFVSGDFEVGDLFFAVYRCRQTNNAWVNAVGIYQGDGEFLTSETHPAACTEETCRRYTQPYVDIIGSENTLVWGDATAMNSLRHYFVLRPSQLAAE